MGDKNLGNILTVISWLPREFLKDFDKDFDIESNQLVCWGTWRFRTLYSANLCFVYID